MGNSSSTGRLLALEQLRPDFEPHHRPLTKCTYMMLSRRSFTSVPEDITKLTGLAFFWLYENEGLSSLPPEVSRLTSLTKFYASYNQLTSIPNEISMLTRLQGLGVGCNYISWLPAGISKLTALQELWVYDNPIEELPPQITALTNLKNLYIEWDGRLSIKRAPRGITNLPCWSNRDDPQMNMTMSFADALKQLELYDPIGPVSEPGWVPLQEHLNFHSLSFHGLNLKELPTSLSLLTKLTYLCMSRNELTEFPKNVCHLTSIEALNISGNKILSLPERVTELTRLRSLIITSNKFQEIPSVVLSMDSVEFLDVSNNQIFNLDEQCKMNF